MSTALKKLTLALLITFSFLAVSKFVNAKEFHSGKIAEDIILNGQVLSSHFSEESGAFYMVVKTGYFGKWDVYHCELTPNSYSCFRPFND